MSTFVYTSVCCIAKAEKPACKKPRQGEQPSTLGAWRCTRCGNKTKVTRKVLTNQEKAGSI